MCRASGCPQPWCCWFGRCFCLPGTARTRRGWASPAPRGREAWGAPLLHLGQSCPTPRNGSPSILKQLLKLYPAVSLGLLAAGCLWPVLYWCRFCLTTGAPAPAPAPPLCPASPVPSILHLHPLGSAGSWLCLCFPQPWPVAARLWPGTPRAPRVPRTFPAGSFMGLQLVEKCKFQERLKCCDCLFNCFNMPMSIHIIIQYKHS